MASGTGGTSTGAVVSSGNAVQLKPVEVSKTLQDGEKFIKWDEVGFSPYHFSPYHQETFAIRASQYVLQ